MNVIELFSGSAVMSKAFRYRGHKTFTIDLHIESEWQVDLLSISDEDFKKKLKSIGFEKVDVVWASPPCTTFSVASISKYWDKNRNPKSYKTYLGLALAKRTIELIKIINPTYYFIENPRGMLRNQFFMDELPIRKTVTYCKYGAKYQKATDIWTNNPHWIPKTACKPLAPCHERASRGSRSGIQGLHKKVTDEITGFTKNAPFERGKIPFMLCEEIVDVCEGKGHKQEVLL